MYGKNSEGYADPTAAQAIAEISREEKTVHALVHVIRDVCRIAGFTVLNRIELEHIQSGRRYR